MAEYLISVGMEVHAELTTKSKMFCRCPVAFGGMPNTRTCPVCLGLPGTLPVPNREAVEMVLKTALALNCTIAVDSVFHRKNYFYPDLPKGYQVSQYGETNPIGYNGYLEIPTDGGGTKRVKIRRVHLEEDTGKLLHLPGGGSGIDFNRAGTPLMEIVTDFPPDITSAEDAREYLKNLRQLLLYLGVCDGKMEQGSLRCEPNISVRPLGSEKYGIKTELKNLNSFRSVFLGVNYEAERQARALENGETMRQETRGWNEQTESSYVMRVKESEADYRYFPCPDLVPMHFDDATIGRIRATLPETPLAKSRRYQSDFGLSEYDAGLIVSDRAWADFFEQTVALGGEAKQVCNWMSSDFARLLKEANQTVGEPEDEHETKTKVTPRHIVDLLKSIESGQISGKIAKTIFEEFFRDGRSVADIIESQGMTQITDEAEIERAVRDVLAESPNQLAQYRSGKETLFGYFVGQTMKRTGGKANPQATQAVIKRILEEN
jgi:aspartyl-tRNA(Asn)/glutamyl-tRNA(Gln) amidotransferase subunit B